VAFAASAVLLFAFINFIIPSLAMCVIREESWIQMHLVTVVVTSYIFFSFSDALFSLFSAAGQIY